MTDTAGVCQVQRGDGMIKRRFKAVLVVDQYVAFSQTMKTLIRVICFGLPAICLGCTTQATTTIKATGAVAKSTIEVGSKVAKTAVGATIDLAGSAFRQSAVTVIDTGTGLSHKVPWKEGLSASGAAEVAAIKKANKAIEIVRDIQRIKADAGTILKPGDVVRIK